MGKRMLVCGQIPSEGSVCGTADTESVAAFKNNDGVNGGGKMMNQLQEQQ